MVLYHMNLRCLFLRSPQIVLNYVTGLFTVCICAVLLFISQIKLYIRSCPFIALTLYAQVLNSVTETPTETTSDTTLLCVGDLSMMNIDCSYFMLAYSESYCLSEKTLDGSSSAADV